MVSATQITATFAIAGNATLGAANVTVTTSGGTSGAVTFTVNAAGPTLTSVSPSSGVRGNSVPVTLTGTNFIAGATVAVSNPNVTVSGVTVVSATQITATFAIAANATLGAANVTVTTSGGTSGAVTFTVNATGPTLTSVNPSSGVRGNSVPVTLTGTNFIAGATVAVSNPNVTVSGVTVVSATQITATFAIAANATLGAANVTVTTSGGTSGAVTFTVNPPAPTLGSVSPNSGVTGSSVPVTLAGTNFVAGATVAVSNPGVTVSGVTVVSATQITATFAIAANATLGAASVTVTTSGGTSPAVTFTVSAPVTFTPIRVNAGASASYTDPLGQVWSADTGFSGATGATSFANAVTGTPAPTLYQTGRFGPYDNSSPMQYQFTVPNGSYIVTLKFDEPVFTQAGQRVFNVLINGQNLLPNFDIFAAAGAQFQAVDVPIPVTVTTGQITIQFVTVVSNNTRVCALEIVAAPVAAPTLTSVSPGSGAKGSSVPVTLSGTNLSSALVINAGPNIAVSNVNVVSATQVTATFTIAAGAPSGAASVKATTEGGTTSSVAFTIQ